VNNLRKYALAAALVLIHSLAVPAARGATYRVDDSASLPRESTALLHWRETVPARGGDNTLEGAIGVVVRLDVAAWVHRCGRVFLVLPEQAAPLVRLGWRTQGRLLAGQIQPGQRVLVYEGVIASPWLEDRLELSIQASGERLAGMQPLSFHFEIDVD
jgi:hypothetical protein